MIKRTSALCFLVVAGSLVLSGFAQQGGKPKLIREPVQDDAPEASAADVKPQHDPLKADKSVEIGKYYFKQGKWEAAAGRFREALNYKADFPEAYQWLARSFEKQKKYKEAAAALQEYEQKFPSSPMAGPLRKERQRLEEKN